jgi:hypothetical protein
MRYFYGVSLLFFNALAFESNGFPLSARSDSIYRLFESLGHRASLGLSIHWVTSNHTSNFN